MGFLLALLWPALAGAGAFWIANKCTGRNARTAFRFLAWGFWLLYLPMLPLGFLPFPIGMILNLYIVKLLPAALSFLMAANSMLKEMRAQQRGEYTDAAQ